MTHVIVATFKAETRAEEAMDALKQSGVSENDVCLLEAGTEIPSPGDRGLVAVKVGPGYMDESRARAVLRSHQGHPVLHCNESRAAMSLIHNLSSAHEPFKPPEAVLPPVLLEAMVDDQVQREQPELSDVHVSYILE